MNKVLKNELNETKIEEDNVIIVQVESSGYDGTNMALIKVNNIKVEVMKNDRKHFRGLHVVVIDQSNGQVLFASVFDTYDNSISFNKFINQEI